MKPALLLSFTALLLLEVHSVSAQSKEIRFLIDTSITIMKKNAANTNAVNWRVLEKNAWAKARNLKDPYELGPVIRYLYRSLNDFHGAFYYADSTFKWSHNQPVVSDSIKNEWNKRSGVKTGILENNIGYLRIPGMQFGVRKDVDEKAQNLNDSLCSLLEKGIKGIVLDLRINGGGAMFPMILGVEQLLGSGRVGSFQTPKRSDWFLKDNNFLIDTAILANMTPKCDIDAQHIPIVILTSPATGSSGEFLIMAFKGREKTILLGSQTAGYITVTNGFPINDKAFILLSTGYGADRQGKLYKEAFKPDISFESPDKFNDIKNDEKVKAAVKWLKDHFN